MQISLAHRSAPNLCVVCVDSAQGRELRGRLFHYYADGPVPYRSHSELLLMIDSLCDRLGYPQKSEASRSFFSARAAKKAETTEKKMSTMEQKMTQEQLEQQKGEEATFVVHVKFRQNATWQGNVTWAEKKQTANFRSALELIRLMDSAVETSVPTEAPQADPHDA